MKKIFVFSVALIGLTACRNDDDKSTNQEASIVGTWQPVKYIAYDGKTNQVIESETENVNDCEQKERFIFTNDGKTTSTHFEINPQLNNTCVQTRAEKGTYKYDSSKKQVSIVWEEEPNETSTAEVIKLTSTEFEVVEEIYDVNNDNVEDKHTTLYKRVN